MSRDLQPDILGPLYAIRLRDLRPWNVIEVTCFGCRHRALLQPDLLRRTLARRLGRQHFDQTYIAKMVELERLMDITTCCQRCGNRANNSLRVLKLPR